MTTIQKITSQIKIGHWTFVQMRMTAAHQFTDTPPLADLSGVGTGPFLAYENGIWKYPQQDVGGRFKVPADTGKPVRLMGVLADLGGNSDWTLTIAGIDGSGARPNNVSGTPYAAGNAALYQEGDIVIATGTAQRYIALNFNTSANDHYAVLAPGQDLIFTTSAGVQPLVRFTFSICQEGM